MTMTKLPGRIPGEEAVGPTLYKLEKTKYGSKQLEKQYEDILGPLSLFASLPSEEVREDDEIEVQRPVTPIEESIKAPPVTFSQLARLIRRRVAAKPDLEHLTQDEQQALAAVIMGEVGCIWPDIRRQVDDPFLTSGENRELQRRITVHIVTVCQQLFHHYLEKAKVLNSRHVFTEQANISRLKAQLSLDANKFLNILAIRRYIVADIRGKLLDVQEDQLFGQDPVQDGSFALSYKKLIECSRPKQKHGLKKTVEQEVRDMDHQMAPIQPLRALEYMPHTEVIQRTLDGCLGEGLSPIHIGSSLDHDPVARQGPRGVTMVEGAPVYGKGADDGIDTSSGDGGTPSTGSIDRHIREERRVVQQFPRAESLPELHANILLEELGMEKPSDSGRPASSRHFGKVSLQRVTEQEVIPQALTQAEFLTSEDGQGKAVSLLKDDLQHLSSYTSMREKARNEPMREDEDLPPLLQAVDETKRKETRRAALQRKMREMEEEGRRQEEDSRYKMTKPTHPQPATVTTKLRKSVVRTSDVRVSERVQQGRVSLQLYKTVFNELTDEIDVNMIKRLDSNLFRGQEINEVYGEIMKTLPMDHHLFDNDDFIELSADPKALQRTPLLGAANLTANKPGRVINSDLCVTGDPPWGEDVAEWCDSLMFNATFAQQNPSKPATSVPVPRVGDIGSHSNLLAGQGQSLSELLEDGGGNHGMMDERNTRTYASWLAWWKGYIGWDDYIKYLATQETDHLGVIFHFFDQESISTEGSKSETDEEQLVQLAREKVRLEKLTELRKQKSEFNEGMWNVGTVTIGGLGRDPDIEDERDDETLASTSVQSPQSICRTHSGKKISMTPRPKGPGASRNASSTRQSKARGETVSPSLVSPETIPLSPQERLEAIWSSLQMPDHMRLDMAIKYSSPEFVDRLAESLEAWEAAVDVVVQREGILSKLEVFERLASDPDRFFQKGQRGSSVTRLEEAKKRSALYAGLQNLEGRSRRRIQHLQKRFGDTVTYEGRPYLDKMRVDCTEMLYWLQQERRQQALGETPHAPSTPTISISDLPVTKIPSITTTVQ